LEQGLFSAASVGSSASESNRTVLVRIQHASRILIHRIPVCGGFRQSRDFCPALGEPFPPPRDLVSRV
jgi:hypothetical protein